MELNPRFRFETYVVGPSNQLAATAAAAVGATPGAAYNPLFVYGRSGLGKTHLLHAVGFAALERHPGLRVRYLTFEELVEQFHAAAAVGQAEAFRGSLDDCDVVLLDDLQFITKHREMQAELLRLCEQLQAGPRQLMLTSDRPPPQIGELDERLVERLQGGLLVDVGAPDFETRLAILRRKAEERGVALDEEVLEAVAELGAANVRELIGMVNKLAAFQAVSDAPLTAVQARGMLAGEEAPAGPEGPAAPAPAAAGADAAAPGARQAPPADEFTSFLTSVRHTVAQSVSAWRERVKEAALRWQGEGFRTARLEALLEHDAVPDLEAVLARFAEECEGLRALAAQAQALDPAAAGDSRFRDPDQLDEARALVRTLAEGVAPPPAPSAALSFDDFVAGESNEALVRAAQLVAREPGRRYNPLYIHGPSGLGKSHLLHAIGNALASSLPQGRVACLSAGAFLEDLRGASGAGRVEWWRRRYRSAGALLLDDVQLIAADEPAQQELFNLFNAFLEAGKQLAFAGDRAPRALAGLPERLVSRFEGGLVVELAAPDRAMREVLVRRQLTQHDVAADDEVVQYLAARPADSARALRGLVNRALSAMDPHDSTLSLRAARAAIEGRGPRPSQAQAVSALMPAGLDPRLADREKLVWDWPDAADRVVEELR